MHFWVLLLKYVEDYAIGQRSVRLIVLGCVNYIDYANQNNYVIS